MTDTTFAPRPHVECDINLRDSFQLPPLSRVRDQAAQLQDLRNRQDGEPEIHVSARFRDGKVAILEDIGQANRLSGPLAWNVKFQELFTFAVFVKSTDVPRDLQEAVIFALKRAREVFDSASEEQISCLGYYAPCWPSQVLRDRLLYNVVVKLVMHLMEPTINRPAEALPLLQWAIEGEGPRVTPELIFNNPVLFAQYATALVLTEDYTQETKGILEIVAQAGEKSPFKNELDLQQVVFEARLHLALVLRERNVEAEKQKEHQDHCVKVLQKRPFWLPQDVLKQLLVHPGRPLHPVLEALGGPPWLDKLGQASTVSDQREFRKCRHCQLGEPQKKLSKCTGCQQVYYCSKECQRSHWKHHKEACTIAAANTQQSNRDRDFDKWTKLADAPLTTAFISALKLQQDPSRGRTHIVLQEVHYTPSASKEYRYKFRTTRCGVYKISDAVPFIENLAFMQRGEGQKRIDEAIAEADSISPLIEKQDKTVSVTLTWEINPFTNNFGCKLGGATIPLDRLRDTPYDPNWRTGLNLPGHPALPMGRLPTGAEGAENQI